MYENQKKGKVLQLPNFQSKEEIELLKLTPSALKPIYCHRVPAFCCKTHINVTFWLALWYFSPYSSFMWQQDLNTKSADLLLQHTFYETFSMPLLLLIHSFPLSPSICRVLSHRWVAYADMLRFFFLTFILW